MRRLLVLLMISAAVLSTGCIAAVPLLLYAKKNRHASAAEVVPAATPDAVRLASHASAPRSAH